jgi:hypothetical protein
MSLPACNTPKCEGRPIYYCAGCWFCRLCWKEAAT